uniref:Ferric-chelate reductase 1b n=1 Tax=Dicentrarchus labrax TaxID=13489 RepID=A0A8P4GA58_DICLA
MWHSYLVLAVLIGCTDPVSGYSNGKVSIACEDMVPQHGYEPSPDPPPYNISVDKSTFSPGDNITVSLRVAFSYPTFFKGFLIEARDAGKWNSPAVGFFILTDPHESQLLQCGHTQGSGVSHTSSTRKTHIQAVWKSPRNPPHRVQFLVTVVHKYNMYWVRIAGPVVSLGVTTVPSTVVPAQTTGPTALSTPLSSAGCGRNKSCLRDPVGCHPESDSHCYFLSFFTDQEGQSVMFELSGPAEGYMSFALSLDKWMGNDDVYLCVNDGGRVTISAAHVTGRKHPELVTEEDLWGQTWRLADGVIQCRFQRSVLLPQQDNRFSLNNSYFLFLAHGRSQQGLISRHDRQPLISTHQKVITGHPEILCGSRSPLLIKFHGVLMLTVWMWMVSTAVFIARHYKPCWPDTTLLGQRLWFQSPSLFFLSVAPSNHDGLGCGPNWCCVHPAFHIQKRMEQACGIPPLHRLHCHGSVCHPANYGNSQTSPRVPQEDHLQLAALRSRHCWTDPRCGMCVLGCCSAGAVASQPLVSCGIDWMAAVDRAGGPAAIDPLLQSQKKRKQQQ